MLRMTIYQSLRALLQGSPLQGVLLPPTGFWRTFVAFELRSPETLDSESDGARLSLIVSAPVLEYHYAEDHFWAFLIWSAGELVSMYLCAFKRRKLDIDFEWYETQWLIDLLPPGVARQALNDLLSPPKSTPNAGRATARQFTELMQTLSNNRYRLDRHG